MKYNKMLLLFVTLFALSGCGFTNNSSSSSNSTNNSTNDSTTNEHYHNYKTSTVEPTCEEDGYTIYECDCGDTYTSDYIPSTGHNYGEWYITTDATCTEDGVRRRDCEVQGCNNYETEVIEATGHSVVVDEEVEASCSSTGLTEGRHCSICHEVFVAQEIIYDGHNYEDGSCKICDATEGLYYTLSDDGNYYTVSKGTTNDVKVVVPEYHRGLPVRGISSYGFQNCTFLESIILPEGVQNIDYHAFLNCSSLKSISIPQSIVNINYASFVGCSSLQYNVYSNGNYLGNSKNPYLIFVNTIDKGIKENNINSQTKIIYSNAFENCSSLEHIMIPASVVNIGIGAFSECTSLKSVTYARDSQLTFINNYAFKYCKDLESIIIPKNVIYISEYAFDYCTSLKTIIVDEDNEIYDSRNDCNAIIETSTNTLIKGCSETIIPNDIDTIGTRAFHYCISLIDITIPDGVKNVDSFAFYYCNSLIRVEIPKSVKKIDQDAFTDCRNLESIIVDEDNEIYDSRNYCNAIIETSTNTLIKGCGKTIIPNDIVSIGARAFYWDETLEFIKIPANVIDIGAGAFYNCFNLESISFAEDSKLSSIGDSAFYNCILIESLTIPNNVKSIGYSAFANCNRLENIVIPNSVISIGYNSFYPLNSLNNVYYIGSEKEWGYITIDHSNDSVFLEKIFYFSETEPELNGNYWHYDSDGNPVKWE